jgi:hypothetical protein
VAVYIDALEEAAAEPTNAADGELCAFFMLCIQRVRDANCEKGAYPELISSSEHECNHAGRNAVDAAGATSSTSEDEEAAEARGPRAQARAHAAEVVQVMVRHHLFCRRSWAAAQAAARPPDTGAGDGAPGQLAASSAMAAAVAAVCRNIHSYHMSLTNSECQVSALVNSDACPRPTTGRRGESGGRAVRAAAPRGTAAQQRRGSSGSDSGRGSASSSSSSGAPPEAGLRGEGGAAVPDALAVLHHLPPPARRRRAAPAAGVEGLLPGRFRRGTPVILLLQFSFVWRIPRSTHGSDK